MTDAADALAAVGRYLQDLVFEEVIVGQFDGRVVIGSNRFAAPAIDLSQACYPRFDRVSSGIVRHHVAIQAVTRFRPDRMWAWWGTGAGSGVKPGGGGILKKKKE